MILDSRQIYHDLLSSKERKKCTLLAWIKICETIFHTSRSETNIVVSSAALYTIVVIGFMYYFIMFAITLDRFLLLRLNIRYHLCWNISRTKTIYILVFCIINISWAVLSCIILPCHDEIYQISFRYHAPVWDTMFIIFAVIIYFYVFFNFTRTERNQKD